MYPIIDLHIYRMCSKALYLLNDIRALILHPTIHQDSESILVLSISSSQDLDLSELDSIPLG